MPPARADESPPRIRRGAVVLVASLAALALFELLARTVLPPFDLSPLWRYHPTLGWTQTPGRSFDVQVEGRPVHIELNSSGFRDVEHAIDKPPGVKRLVVIGDSFCEAAQVNLEEIFWRRLGSALSERTGDPWEVINLGVGDHGNAQAWVALTTIGLAYEPDVVLHEIFPLNDVLNNSRQLAFLARSPNDRYRPYLVVRDGELELTSAQPLRNALRRNVLVYGLLEHAWLKAFPGPDITLDEHRAPLLREAGFEGLDPLLLTFAADEDQPPKIRQAWELTERIEAKIAQTCRDARIPLVTVVIPFEGMLGDNTERFLAAQPPPPLVPDYAQRRLARLFAELDVPCVTLWDTFDADPARFLPYIDGHLTAEGHRAAADEVLSAMVEAGLVE